MIEQDVIPDRSLGFCGRSGALRQDIEKTVVAQLRYRGRSGFGE